MWGAFIEILVYFNGKYNNYGCSRLAAVFALIDVSRVFFFQFSEKP